MNGQRHQGARIARVERQPVEEALRRSFNGVACLVTGGAGFIGSHVADTLVTLGALVTVLDDLSVGKLENLGACLDSVEFVKGTILDESLCQRTCRGKDLVIHLAAEGSVPRSLANPAATLTVNVAGTANVFTACRDGKVARVVYASSSSVYGDSLDLPKREGSEGRPLSPYALSKAMNEQLAALFSHCFGTKIIGLRYFNVFGPRQDPLGDYAAVIPRFFAAHLNKQAPLIYGNGEQSRDFIYVGDAVRATLLAGLASSDCCGRAYNVASGRRVTISELESGVRELCGGGLGPVHAPERPGDIAHSHADLHLARECLGYEPRFSLEAGLKSTLSSFVGSRARGS